MRPPASPLDPDEPEPKVIAAAAVLGAAPQREEALRAVAIETLRAAGEVAQAERRARGIVTGLRALGWLDARGLNLAAAHDVVADEVLAQVLRTRLAGELRDEVLPSVLAAAKRSARTLGRLALALRRVLGPPEAASPFEEALSAGAVRWFNAAAGELGTMVAAANPDESSYALGAVVEGPPWATAAEACWETIVESWLGRHGELPAARHLLFRGLRLEGNVGRRLVAPGLHWLTRENNRASFEASFVLAPLLGRADLEAPSSKQAVAYALGWLKDHGSTAEAQFVLHPLLGRADLEAPSSKQAVAYALGWLKDHGSTAEARFVLDPLFGRADLEAPSSKEAAAYALGWLKDHGSTAEAPFVLHTLLGRAIWMRRAARKPLHMRSAG